MRPLHKADSLTTFICLLPWNLGATTSWYPEGLSRPVTGIAVLLRVYLRSIWVLFYHLILGLPNVCLSRVSPSKPCLYLFPPIHATLPTHQIVLHFITLMIFGEEYRSRSSLLCNSLRSPITSSPLGPNISLSIIFSETLILCSSLHVRDQV